MDWLATEEEVDHVFGVTVVDQKLWVGAGGYIGAPVPTEDAKFWSLEEHFYKEANVDADYWTHERLAQRHELEQKAKLRAVVREEGRKALLMKQRKMMQESHHPLRDDSPSRTPFPLIIQSRQPTRLRHRRQRRLHPRKTGPTPRSPPR